MLKDCSICYVTKEDTEFYRNKRYKSGLLPYCKSCSAIRGKEYMREYRKQNKLYEPRVIEQLGSKCSRCGFDDTRALTLYHNNNDGTYSQRSSKNSSRAFYFRLITEERPKYRDEDIVVLCLNCYTIACSESKED